MGCRASQVISPLPVEKTSPMLGVVPETPAGLSASLMTTGIKPDCSMESSLRAEFRPVQGDQPAEMPSTTVINVQPARKSEARQRPPPPAPILVKEETSGSSGVSRTWDFGNALRRWSTLSTSRLAGSTPMARKNTYGSIPLSSRVSVNVYDGELEEGDVDDPFGFLSHLMTNAGLSKAQQMSFKEAFDTVVYSAGVDIVKQGEEADAFFVIQSGEVAVTELDDEELGTGSHVLCRLYEGHFFGHYCMVAEGLHLRNAGVVARTACTMKRLSKTDFNALASQEPMLVSFMHELCEETEFIRKHRQWEI